MESARKVRVEDGSEDTSERARVRQDSGLESLEKVLRFTLPSRDGETETGRPRASLSVRDITHALELVHGAAQNMKAAEERARESEVRTQALVQRATEELKSAEARVQASEARVRAAEARAQEAEARAREAEEWLSQIFSTISEELPPRDFARE